MSSNLHAQAYIALGTCNGFSFLCQVNNTCSYCCAGTHLSMETSIVMLYIFLSKVLRYLLALQRFNAVYLSSIAVFFSNFYALSLLVRKYGPYEMDISPYLVPLHLLFVFLGEVFLMT